MTGRKKKVCALVLLLSLLLTGCGSITNGEYLSIHRHEQEQETIADDGQMITVTNYNELVTAMLQYVENCDGYGIIRAVGYAGDIEDDAPRACMEVSYGTPMGAFAVYYMTCKVSKIVTYYDVEVFVTYKRTAEEISKVDKLSTGYAVQTRLEAAIKEYKDEVIFKTDSEILTEKYFQQIIEKLYYTKGISSVGKPEIETIIYPEDANVRDMRVVELHLKYTFSQSTMRDIEKEVQSAANMMIRGVSKDDHSTALFELCTRLAAATQLEPDPETDEDYDHAASINTFYGAFVTRRASSEGLAISYKLLCNKIGMECIVVCGRYNGSKHAWNIVNLDGVYYHVDVSRCFAEGVAEIFLKSDDEMPSEYKWDTEYYVACPERYIRESVHGDDPNSMIEAPTA